MSKDGSLVVIVIGKTYLCILYMVSNKQVVENVDFLLVNVIVLHELNKTFRPDEYSYVS